MKQERTRKCINQPWISGLKTLALLFFLSSKILGAEKRALIISIGDYPDNKELNQNWGDLSSSNDAEIIQKLLIDQGFSLDNIWSLKDKQATASNIRDHFNKMLATLEYGDIVLIHYSGHGQQVSDINFKGQDFFTALKQDEADGFDESLVAYNAPTVAYNGYDLSEHIIDDELNVFLEGVRLKIGAKGQVIMILDACHSGTATRGVSDDAVKTRGSSVKCIVGGVSKKIDIGSSTPQYGFSIDVDESTSVNEKGSIAIFSGCRANEVNREWYDPESGLQFGSLTYAFATAFKKLNKDASYKNLFENINAQLLQKFNQAQHPELEGDIINQLIFNGTLIESKELYKVHSILDPYSLKINGGAFAGHSNGDTVLISQIKKNNRTSWGSRKMGFIIKVGTSFSVVRFERIHGVNTSRMGDFQLVVKRKKTTNSTAVKLDISSRKLRKNMEGVLASRGFVLNGSEAMLTLRDTSIERGVGVIAELNHSGEKLLGLPFKQLYNDQSLDTLLQIIQKGIRIQKFRHLEVSSRSHLIDVKMHVLNRETKKDENRATLMVGEGETLYITIKNCFDKPLFIDVLDVYPNNEIHKVDEAMDYDLKFNFEAVPPKDSLVFQTEIFPPFGLEEFKIIASTQRLDFSPILNLGKSLAQTRGANSERFIDALIQQSNLGVKKRGEAQDELEISNHYFQIVPN